VVRTIILGTGTNERDLRSFDKIIMVPFSTGCADHLIQNISGTGHFVVGVGDINILYQLPELDWEAHSSLSILRDKVKHFWMLAFWRSLFMAKRSLLSPPISGRCH